MRNTQSEGRCLAGPRPFEKRKVETSQEMSEYSLTADVLSSIRRTQLVCPEQAPSAASLVHLREESLRTGVSLCNPVSFRPYLLIPHFSSCQDATACWDARTRDSTHVAVGKRFPFTLIMMWFFTSEPCRFHLGVLEIFRSQEREFLTETSRSKDCSYNCLCVFS